MNDAYSIDNTTTYSNVYNTNSNTYYNTTVKQITNLGDSDANIKSYF